MRLCKIVDDLEDLLHGKPNGQKSTLSSPTPKTKKARERRSPEEVTKQAHEMLAFIKKAGEEGVLGKEINRKFGKVVGTTKAFIETRTGEKVKTKGERSAMRYFAA